MPDKDRFCWRHKRAYDAMMSAAKVIDKNDNQAKAVSKLKAKNNRAGDPPSEFSEDVLKYEAQCPPTPRGVKRVQCDL
eukprot:4049252-Lingulodinium_polyedra.AAC.1